MRSVYGPRGTLKSCCFHAVTSYRHASIVTIFANHILGIPWCPVAVCLRFPASSTVTLQCFLQALGHSGIGGFFVDLTCHGSDCVGCVVHAEVGAHGDTGTCSEGAATDASHQACCGPRTFRSDGNNGISDMFSS